MSESWVGPCGLDMGPLAVQRSKQKQVFVPIILVPAKACNGLRRPWMGRERGEKLLVIHYVSKQATICNDDQVCNDQEQRGNNQ